MNRITVKVQTNRAEKAIREAHPRLVKKTVPMGGGWWHITLECKANGATALAKLKERFGWARFSPWVHCQALTSATGKPLELPPVAQEVTPLEALRQLMEYVGGWDEIHPHPCAVAARVLRQHGVVQ